MNKKEKLDSYYKTYDTLKEIDAWNLRVKD